MFALCCFCYSDILTTVNVFVVHILFDLCTLLGSYYIEMYRFIFICEKNVKKYKTKITVAAKVKVVFSFIAYKIHLVQS